MKRPQDKLSNEDRNFLHGQLKETKPHSQMMISEDGFTTPKAKHTRKSPSPLKRTDWANITQLTEVEKKSLEILGLSPNSDFVRNIAAYTSRSPKSTQL